MGWDKEENYAKKTDLEKYTKKNIFNKKVSEIESTLEKKISKDDLPDHSIYALKEEILKLRVELNEFVKKSDVPSVLQTHAAHIMKYIEPYTNYRYCTNELFHKIKHDLNVKLKKLLPGWKNV